jgi:hypothetical protein
MSTPVRGGPEGPLGYAPPRARQAGTARANTVFDNSEGLGSSPSLQGLEDNPSRIGSSLRNDNDAALPRDASPPLRSGGSLRDALSSRDGFASRETGSLREALSPRESLNSRDPLSRDAATSRSPAPAREGLASRDPLSRDAATLRSPAPAREGLASRDPLSRDSATLRSPAPPREGLASREPLTRDGATLRSPAPPREGLASREPLTRDSGTSRFSTSLRERLALRDALAARDTAPSRDAFSRLDTPPSGDALSPPDPASWRETRSRGELISDSGPRSLLDEAADLGLSPSGEAVSRREGSSTRAASAPPGLDTTWKRKKRSSEVFEGDTALKELRTRLAMAPTDQTPEPPLAPAKTPIFGSAVRLMGVVGLAAGGALGFLWITSPHGPRSAAVPQAADEVALVSLRPVEPSKPSIQNFAAERTPDPAPSSDTSPSWTMANYTSDAAEKAIAPPVLPQPRMAGPPRSPIAPRAVTAPSPPFQPAPAAVVAPAPPPPAPAPVPVVAAPVPLPAPGALAVAPLDRDEINAMLVRARTFLSTGDVAAARVVLRRAAASDDAQAALALGGTYDPSVLKKLGIISFHADPALAREWYRKAAALGSADASLRLEQLVQTDR